MMAQREQDSDFRRTVRDDFALSTCLNCGTSLLSAPAQNITKLEADHRVKCEAQSQFVQAPKPRTTIPITV